ncbi:DUF4398 domain-containing protein [Pendulispora albinea]|uniref:DUF4398 domain-containing protein n=1 Tax=Pendulispora albinea TaxID=2741071 RepID=A0ABZ2LQ02_9BACT
MKHIASIAAAATALSLMVGCGSYPAPNDKLVNSQASLRAAQEVGAQTDSQGALHMRLAQEQIEKAKQLMADGDNKRAEFLLLRAEADAELAVALARQQSARNEAQQALEQLKALKGGR